MELPRVAVDLTLVTANSTAGSTAVPEVVAVVEGLRLGQGLHCWSLKRWWLVCVLSFGATDSSCRSVLSPVVCHRGLAGSMVPGQLE
ncbi:hypothetical protein HPB47_017962 [Ixodes persulcatus]|uniref:Uncharacterized protein n=1 Tax=Ixodes persulcatus TaxID=34615 RepID=A0AC60QLY6_IXOPE|nr:hypothetical protein HPB47_017962 [Ixodes persulcatus]